MKLEAQCLQPKTSTNRNAAMQLNLANQPLEMTKHYAEFGGTLSIHPIISCNQTRPATEVACSASALICHRRI
jgi:hypothetical protein